MNFSLKILVSRFSGSGKSFAFRPSLGFALAFGMLSQAAYSQTPGNALEFDGLNGYVKIDRTDTVIGANWAAEKTLSVWLNPTAPTGPAVRPEIGELIVGNDRPRTFGISRALWDGEDRIWAFNADANGVDFVGVPIIPGEWVQITVVHSGGFLWIYRNGQAIEGVPSGPTESQGGIAVGSIYFGGSESSRTRHLGGQLDEVRLWSLGLAEAVIQAWVDRPLNSSHPNWSNLSAYYQMSDGSGTALTDDGTGGNTGTLLGGMGNQSWVASGAFGGGGSVNTAPVADAQAVSTDEDVPVAVFLTGSDADGDALGFQVVSGPLSGSLSGTAPDLLYTPAQDFNGTDSFRFVVDDGLAQSAEAEVTVMVAAVNDAPVAVDDSAATTEGTAVTIAVLSNDSDVDGDLLQVSGFTPAAFGTVENLLDQVRYTPGPGFLGDDTFTYTIWDGSAFATAQVTVTVSGVNAAPVADAQALATDEDVPVAVLLAGSDPDGDTLTFQVVSGPSSGSLSGTAPDLVYTPAQDFNGIDNFRFVADDGLAQSPEAEVTFTVNAVNDPPTAADDTATTIEETPVTVAVLDNDSDVDGDQLQVTGVTTAASGIVENLVTEVRYTPGAGFTGSDSFSYTIADGQGEVATAQVTVTVSPLVGPAGYALEFDGATDYVRLAETATMMDPGWETSKTVSLWVRPLGATPTCISVALCDAVFGDLPRWWGISRGVVGSSDRIWIWNYDGGLDVLAVDYTIGEWTHIALVHGDGVLRAYKNGVEVGSRVSGATLQPNTGASPFLQIGGGMSSADFTFEGQIDELAIWNYGRTAQELAADFHGILSGDEAGLKAYYRMSNGSGGSLSDDSLNSWDGTLLDGGPGVPPDGDSASWVISSAPITHIPTANPLSATTDEEVPVALHLTGSDVDGEALSFVVVSGPASGGLSGAGPDLIYTPAPNFNGTDSFRFVADDGLSRSTEAVVTLTVNPVNDPPVAVDDSVLTSENTAVAIPVLSNDIDVDGDGLEVTEVTPAGFGTVENLVSQVRYTPNLGFSGDDTFTYTIWDGLAFATGQVTVTVSGVNVAPVADLQSVTTDEDVSAAVVLTGSDADLDPLTFQVVSGPSSGSLSGTAPNLVYTPAQDFNGIDSFRFVANDGLAQSAEAEVTVTVTAVNDPPVAVDDTASTLENSPVSVLVAANDTDVDNNLDLASVVLLSGPANGVVSSGGAGSLTYTPATDFVGSDGFTYRICDTGGACDDAAVSVDVSEVVNPPVANDDSAVTDEDTPVTVDVAANDTDVDGNLDPASTLILIAPANGGVAVNPDGSVTYSPASDFNGGDNFTYQICDTGAACDNAVVNITVNPVNDVPVAVEDTAVTPVSTPVVIAVLNNDSDPDGDTLSIQAAGPAANGTVEILGGTINYVPDAGFLGIDAFNYTVSDGNTGTATAQVTVTVTNELLLQEVGSLITPGDAWGVTVRDGLAYVADVAGGLRIIDVSVPASPVEIGFYDTPVPGRTYDVEVDGDLAYLADNRAGLRILNISDPTAPFEVGLVDTPEFAWGIALDLPWVYVADRWGGLRIINASDPSQPVEVGFLDTPGQAVNLSVQGNLVWIADFDSGIRLVDVSDKTNPIELGSLGLQGNVYDVLASDGYLYVAQGLSGLAILDISDPFNPIQEGWVDTAGLSRSVALMGGFAFLSDESEGMQVIDVFDPLQPAWAGTVDTPGRARGTAAADGYAYVADHEGGLRIIRVY